MPIPPVDLTQFTNSRVLPLKDTKGNQLDVHLKAPTDPDLTDAEIKELLADPNFTANPDKYYAKMRPGEQARTQALFNSTATPFQKIVQRGKGLLGGVGKAALTPPGLGESTGAAVGGVLGENPLTAGVGGMLGNLADQSKVFSSEPPSVMDKPFSLAGVAGAGVRQAGLTAGTKLVGNFVAGGFNKAFGGLPLKSARTASNKLHPFLATSPEAEKAEAYAMSRRAGEAVRKEVGRMTSPITAQEGFGGLSAKIRDISPGATPLKYASAAKSRALDIYQQNFADKNLPPLEALQAKRNMGKTYRVAKAQGLEAAPGTQVDDLFRKNLKTSLESRSTRLRGLNKQSKNAVDLITALEKENDPNRYIARRLILSGMTGGLMGGMTGGAAGPLEGLAGAGAVMGMTSPLAARNVARSALMISKGLPVMGNIANATNEVEKRVTMRKPK